MTVLFAPHWHWSARGESPFVALVAQRGFAYHDAMARIRLKSFFPASFYGRAVLILIVPIIVIQIVLSVVFIQRHYERVTVQLSTNTAQTLRVVLETLEDAATPETWLAEVAPLLAQLQINVRLPATLPDELPPPRRFDLVGAQMLDAIAAEIPQIAAADLSRDGGANRFWFPTRHGLLEASVPRRLLTTANPHQLLVIVFLASVVMTLIAFQFLRLQIRPVRRLGAAAEAYGKGMHVPLRASGAREIRAAAHAFIDMRNRLERQRAQQKIMLSGVSHDMRTPLTRMRLILSMMPDDDDRSALEAEISDLSHRLERFLDYTRGHMEEAPQPVVIAEIIAELCARYTAAGHAVEAPAPARAVPALMLRRSMLERALDNLISNALRHGSRVQVCHRLEGQALWLAVEDDGPGIPPELRERACEPFARLDEARNSDDGGMGLGLAIVSEAARAHGGRLTLGESALGGLQAALSLPASRAS